MSKQKLVKEYLSNLVEAEKKKVHVIFQKTIVDVNDEPNTRFLFDCYHELDFQKVKGQLQDANHKKLKGTMEVIWNPKKDYKPAPPKPPEPSEKDKEIAKLKAELKAAKEQKEPTTTPEDKTKK